MLTRATALHHAKGSIALLIAGPHMGNLDCEFNELYETKSKSGRNECLLTFVHSVIYE